ncbi:MAG: hypothetical protein ACK40X_04005, partial [Armatimonadota bacterium]
MLGKRKFCQLTFLWLLATVISFPSFSFGQPVGIYRDLYNGVDEEKLRSIVTTLASFGSRVVGYPGERLAAEYIRQQFLALGLDSVREQTFYAVTPIEETPTYLEVPKLGKRYRIYP